MVFALVTELPSLPGSRCRTASGLFFFAIKIATRVTSSAASSGRAKSKQWDEEPPPRGIFFHVTLVVGSGAVGICWMAWGDGCHSVVRSRTNTERFQLTNTFSEAEAALFVTAGSAMFVYNGLWGFFYICFFFASVCKQQSHSHAKQSPHTPDPELQLIWHQVPGLHGVLC